MLDGFRSHCGIWVHFTLLQIGSLTVPLKKSKTLLPGASHSFNDREWRKEMATWPRASISQLTVEPLCLWAAEMWPGWLFRALRAALEHHIHGMAPLRWSQSHPALHQLIEFSQGFSRNYYLYSAQSEIWGMGKEDVGGTLCFSAHKIRGFSGSRVWCILEVVTLEEDTAELLVRQIYKDVEFPY